MAHSCGVKAIRRFFKRHKISYKKNSARLRADAARRASAPALDGAFPTYRRLAVALDTGGAIKGEARADLYLGQGAAAGLEAGRVRHALRLYRLTPLDGPGS